MLIYSLLTFASAACSVFAITNPPPGFENGPNVISASGMGLDSLSSESFGGTRALFRRQAKGKKAQLIQDLERVLAQLRGQKKGKKKGKGKKRKGKKRKGKKGKGKKAKKAADQN
jgi:hypothetical protein